MDGDSDVILFKGEGDYDLRSAELSILPFGKKQFRAIIDQYEGVTPEQKSKLWDYYANTIGKAYDAHRLGQGVRLTRESLEGMGISRAGFETFCREIGLSGADTVALFDECEAVVTERNDAQEQSQEEAATANNFEKAEKEHSGALPKEQAQLLLRKILADPSHPYNDDKATPADHDLAVAGVNRLYAIIAGMETKIDGYAEEHLAAKEQELREAYGISGSVYKSGDFKSSNNIAADQSWKNGPDTGKDNLARMHAPSEEGEGEGDTDV